MLFHGDGEAGKREKMEEDKRVDGGARGRRGELVVFHEEYMEKDPEARQFYALSQPPTSLSSIVFISAQSIYPYKKRSYILVFLYIVCNEGEYRVGCSLSSLCQMLKSLLRGQECAILPYTDYVEDGKPSQRILSLEEWFSQHLVHYGAEQALLDVCNPTILPPAPSLHPEKAGFLEKKGHIVKNWKTRWFILCHLQAYYYVSALAEVPSGCIPLKYANVDMSARVATKHYFYVRCAAPAIEYLMRCVDREVMESWIQALRVAKVTVSAHKATDDDIGRSYGGDLGLQSLQIHRLKKFLQDDSVVSSVLLPVSPLNSMGENTNALFYSPTTPGRYDGRSQSLVDLLRERSEGKSARRVSLYPYKLPTVRKEGEEDTGKLVSKAALTQRIYEDEISDVDICTYVLCYEHFAPLDVLLHQISSRISSFVADFDKSKMHALQRHLDICVLLVDFQFRDITKDPSVSEILITSLEHIPASIIDFPDVEEQVVLFKKVLHMNLYPEEALRNANVPSPILPALFNECSVDLMALDDLELARQMTLLEHGMLRALSMADLAMVKWPKQKARFPDLSQRVKACSIAKVSQFFNRMSGWVAHIIVTEKSQPLRVILIERFIGIMHHLRELRNYTSILQIMAGLEHISIYRLHSTWKQLDSDSKALFTELRELTVPNGLYKNIRSKLAEVGDHPCVPFLGAFLSDIVFIHESWPKELEGDLLPWDVMKKQATAACVLNKMLSIPYPIEEVPSIQHAFRSLPAPLSDEDLFSLSIALTDAGKGSP